jgi:hypothetical protein
MEIHTTGENIKKRIAQGDRLADPSTKKTYIVTSPVIGDSYIILEEVGGDHQVLMSGKS